MNIDVLLMFTTHTKLISTDKVRNTLNISAGRLDSSECTEDPCKQMIYKNEDRLTPTSAATPKIRQGKLRMRITAKGRA